MHDLFSPDHNNDGHRQVYSVSALNQEVRQLLEGSYPLIWVEGEISNFSRPSSGHCYFSLRDRDAQVRCAMFRSRAMNLRFRPEDGSHVLLRARVGLYAARGDFQLVVEHMEEAGDGRLRRAFEELKQRLQREGLFEPAGRQPLPPLPRRLGVITSPTGAAIHDVLTVLKRRYPALPVLIYPVPVQGAGAAEQIAATIELADRRDEVDVLLLTRGGGSLEDLWAFNEEIVARAVRACSIPVVAAIGHEVDLTIAELAADLRAPTPSAAAEAISPDVATWLTSLSRQAERLHQLARTQLNRWQERISWLQQRIDQHHPQRRLQDLNQQLDERQSRLEQAMQRTLRELAQRQQHIGARLLQRSPTRQTATLAQHTEELKRRLIAATYRQLRDKEQTLAFNAHRLDTISPLATLARGYAVVRHDPSGDILRRAADTAPGERIVAKLAEGELQCLVETVNKTS